MPKRYTLCAIVPRILSAMMSSGFSNPSMQGKTGTATTLNFA